MVSDERITELINWLSNIEGLDKAMAGSEMLDICTELLARRGECQAARRLRREIHRVCSTPVTFLEEELSNFKSGIWKAMATYDEARLATDAIEINKGVL